MKLRCKLCNEDHAADWRHFKLVLYERKEVFEGRGKNRKSLGIKPVLVGYVCGKCDSKRQRGQFIKQHGLKQKPGQRMITSIKNKLEELKLIETTKRKE